MNELIKGDFMNLLEAIEKRHSVRQYSNKKIEGSIEKSILS